MEWRARPSGIVRWALEVTTRIYHLSQSQQTAHSLTHPHDMSSGDGADSQYISTVYMLCARPQLRSNETFANQNKCVREERAVLNCSGGGRCIGMTGHEMTMQLRWA